MMPSPPTLATLETRVTQHPWQAVGAAFLVGAWLGLEPPHAPRNAIARAMFAMVGSIAIRVVRELALGELAAHTARPMQKPGS